MAPDRVAVALLAGLLAWMVVLLAVTGAGGCGVCGGRVGVECGSRHAPPGHEPYNLAHRAHPARRAGALAREVLHMRKLVE